MSARLQRVKQRCASQFISTNATSSSCETRENCGGGEELQVREQVCGQRALLELPERVEDERVGVRAARGAEGDADGCLEGKGHAYRAAQTK